MLARDVDDGIVDYAMTGWFGGAEAEVDRMALTARFQDSAGAPLGSNTIGNVTASERGGVTGLLWRFAIGGVPTGTRSIEFLLASEAVAGTNDASADNLGFVLSTHPDPSFRISVAFLSPEARHILVDTTLTNRLYVLEHSGNLQDWEAVSPPAPGTRCRS